MRSKESDHKQRNVCAWAQTNTQTFEIFWMLGNKKCKDHKANVLSHIPTLCLCWELRRISQHKVTLKHWKHFENTSVDCANSQGQAPDVESSTRSSRVKPRLKSQLREGDAWRCSFTFFGSRPSRSGTENMCSVEFADPQVGWSWPGSQCHIMSYPILWTLQRLQLCQLCHVRFQRNICSQVAESKRTIKSGNKSTSNLCKSVLDLHVTCKMCSMCSVQRLKPIAIEALR